MPFECDTRGHFRLISALAETSLAGWAASEFPLGTRIRFNSRVRSWLRMNAGGVPNTCKSNEREMKPSDSQASGGRVSNAWVTCLTEGDNSLKRLLIPHKHTVPHGTG